MDKVILKFGGTSLTTIEKKEKIVKIIKETLKKDEMPIIVVSAIGRFDDAYATDTLISLVDDKFKYENKQAMDLLMSCGETISSVVMSSYLKSNGINAMPVTGGKAGIITNNNFGSAKLKKFNNKYINNLIKHNIIPIVCGFQGINEDGFVTTLGRGGSDTTATILGAYLKAKRIEIYKDVDGIMTSDPKEDSNAKLFRHLTYDEAYEIAINGAKVIHQNAIIYAKEKNIPIYVKNLLGNKAGTLISK